MLACEAIREGMRVGDSIGLGRLTAEPGQHRHSV